MNLYRDRLSRNSLFYKTLTSESNIVSKSLFCKNGAYYYPQMGIVNKLIFE